MKLSLTIAILFVGITSSTARDFIVSSTADSGEGSLRQAILDANDHYGPDKIVFNIPMSDRGFLPAHTTGQPGEAFFIRLVKPLPLITEALILDGKSQTRFTGDTNPALPGFPGAEVIIMHQKITEQLTPGFAEGVPLESYSQMGGELITVSTDTIIMAATLMIQDIEMVEWQSKAQQRKMTQVVGGKLPHR